MSIPVDRAGSPFDHAPKLRLILRLGAMLVLGVVGMRTAGAEPQAAAPPTVAPDEVDPEARRFTTEGMSEFNSGHFAEAIEAFKAAYQRTPAPALLYNLAQAYRMQRTCALALETYRRYLDSNPAGKLRELTEKHISEMQACVLAQKPPAASAPAVPPPPLPSVPAPQDPGLLVRAPAVAPAVAPSRRIRPRTLATIGAGLAAGGLLAAGGYFTWQAHQASNDVTQVFRDRQAWDGAAMKSQEQGIAAQRRAWGFGVTGLVMAGVAALLGYGR
ncbi:MAG TPA: tetratricopeptide repeat protein [Polyangia bacterium]|jgi:tetratricopeptide (TPR) repeat protein|nr:tetratricopeptide repeat protein [Polyangia bacterium]